MGFQFMKILFILQFDSFIKTLLPVYDQLYKKHFDLELVLLKHWRKKNWISNEITKLLNNYPYAIYGRRKILDKLNGGYNVVIVGTTGGIITRVYNYRQKNKLKFKIVTGYVGALLNNNQRSFILGVKKRSQSDLIWVPGKSAAIKILDTQLVDTEKTIIVNTGLPRFDELFHLSKYWYNNCRNLILFIEQPTYPKTYKERKKLVFRLIKIAESYPKHTLIIKPRFREKIGHAHKPKHLLPEILKKIANKPNNIISSNSDLYSLFPNTDFALTISSTGGLESLLVNVPTYFINDFCKKTNLYGSEYFKVLGAVTNTQNIINKDTPKINFNYAHDLLLFNGNSTQNFVNAIIKLVKSE